MNHHRLSGLAAFVVLTLTAPAGAVSGAELYQSQANLYGRFEARIRFAAGDGVISSFFLWKTGSEAAGAFWNELDFEKLGADCHLQTNALFGAPVADHSQTTPIPGNLCAEYHTYGFEWTPTSIAFLVDGVEIRRDVGATATAFAQNATAGMQIHFNIWPGDATFGGNFSPAILPVHQYISWVQYSSFANGTFSLQWREEFDGGTLPPAWSVGNWPSPKNLSTHVPANATFVGGMAELSITADNATGFAGQPPPDNTIGDSGIDGAGNSGAAGQSGGTSRPDGSASSGSGGAGGTSGSESGGAGGSGLGSGGSGGRDGLGGVGPDSGPGGSTVGGASGTGGASPSTMSSGAGGQATGGSPNTGGGAPPSAGGTAGSQPPPNGTSSPAGGSGCGCRMLAPSPFGKGEGALAIALASLIVSRRRKRLRRPAARPKTPAQ